MASFSPKPVSKRAMGGGVPRPLSPLSPILEPDPLAGRSLPQLLSAPPRCPLARHQRNTRSVRCRPILRAGPVWPPPGRAFQAPNIPPPQPPYILAPVTRAGQGTVTLTHHASGRTGVYQVYPTSWTCLRTASGPRGRPVAAERDRSCAARAQQDRRTRPPRALTAPAAGHHRCEPRRAPWE